MQTEMFTTENGLKTKLKALASTCTPMDPFMKEIGNMINKMDRARKNGQTVPLTKVST